MSVVDVSAYFAGVDPLAETKTVIWRPVTATTVIKVGQPVCYDSDCVHDVQERTVNPSARGADYAEGSQNFSGRLFVVEEPLTANLMSWAGIVAKLGSKAGADGDTIVIYVPKEGAIVPVYTDEYCYADRTILGIRDGEADVTYPGRPIGVAMEDIDRATTDGLVWMKFHNFIYDNQNEALEVDDEANAVNVIGVHKINVKFIQTSGQCSALHIKAESSLGATSAYKGLAFYAEAIVSGTVASHVTGAGVRLTISGGTPAEYLMGFQAYLKEDTAVAMTSAQRVAALSLGLQVTHDVTANCLSFIHLENNGAQTPDAFIQVGLIGEMGGARCTEAAVVDGDSDWTIPIRDNNHVYYLRAFADDQVS